MCVEPLSIRPIFQSGHKASRRDCWAQAGVCAALASGQQLRFKATGRSRRHCGGLREASHLAWFCARLSRNSCTVNESGLVPSSTALRAAECGGSCFSHWAAGQPRTRLLSCLPCDAPSATALGMHLPHAYAPQQPSRRLKRLSLSLNLQCPRPSRIRTPCGPEAPPTSAAPPPAPPAARRQSCRLWPPQACLAQRCTRCCGCEGMGQRHGWLRRKGMGGARLGRQGQQGFAGSRRCAAAAAGLLLPPAKAGSS